MANTLEHAFFYNSENHDRIYDADSFEYWLKKFFTSGVFTGELQVTANDDMTVTISGGYVDIDGKVKFFAGDQTIQLETAHATYDRIDTIVLERNDTERDIFAKVVTGGYSSDPAPIAPVRENGIYQLVTAQISIAHGAVRITQADITDTRTNPELCGIVTCTVTQYDFSQFQAQFDSYFANYKDYIATDYADFQADITRLENAGQSSYEELLAQFATYTDQEKAIFLEWFNQMKGQLSEDAAGHLQIELDEAAETEFRRYTGLVEQNTEFLPDGSIKTVNESATIITTKGTDAGGHKIITEVATPTSATDPFIYTKVTTFYPKTDTENKKITEVYTRE